MLLIANHILSQLSVNNYEHVHITTAELW